MNQATVIKRIKKKQPLDALDLLDACGLPLQLTNWGQFRNVYDVLGTQLVIKVPIQESKASGTRINIQHAREEYAAWKKIKSSRHEYRSLKPYLPDMIYFNSRSGIIVMPKYGPVRWPRGRGRHRVIEELESRFTSALQVTYADIKEDNLGSDKDGNIKVLDLGPLSGDV